MVSENGPKGPQGAALLVAWLCWSRYFLVAGRVSLGLGKVSNAQAGPSVSLPAA